MDKLELLAENVVPVNHTGSTAKELSLIHIARNTRPETGSNTLPII